MINKKIGVIIPIISAIVILSVIFYLSYLSFNQEEEYNMPILDSGLCRMADHPNLGSYVDEQIIDCADTYNPPKRITFLESLWYDFLNTIGVFEK